MMNLSRRTFLRMMEAVPISLPSVGAPRLPSLVRSSRYEQLHLTRRPEVKAHSGLQRMEEVAEA